jgi:hypothetical protein
MVLLKNGENQATLEQNRPPAVISMVLRVHNYVSQNNKRTGSDIYIYNHGYQSTPYNTTGLNNRLFPENNLFSYENESEM